MRLETENGTVMPLWVSQGCSAVVGVVSRRFGGGGACVAVFVREKKREGGRGSGAGSLCLSGDGFRVFKDLKTCPDFAHKSRSGGRRLLRRSWLLRPLLVRRNAWRGGCCSPTLADGRSRSPG